MKELKLFSYIRKYRIIIVLLSLLMGILFYSYFSGKQTYTASAIIQYRNGEAVEGLAPDGTEIDVTEIYSADVMTKVFEKLGLNYDENNMDAIRTGVHVEAVQSREEAAVQEALNEKGEEAVKKPTMYLVSYTVGNRDVKNAEEFSRHILNAMLGAYVETYAENHVNSAIPIYSVSGVYDKDYDYIEMVEILEDSVKRALEQLSFKKGIQFRSSDTGYTFSDLNREFSLLQDIDLPNVHAYVLGNRITKDQDVLISKYENRIRTSILENDASISERGGIEEILDTYVNMMRGSGNTDFTHEYILEEVYDNYYDDAATEAERSRVQAEQTTEYDALMNDYVKEHTAYEHTLIDIAYSRYILDVYSGNVNDDSGVNVQVTENPGRDDGMEAEGYDGTVTFDVDTVVREKLVSSPQSQSTAYETIRDVTDRIDFLYRTTLATNQEYNRYAGAENISILTDTVTEPALNLPVYTVLAVILFGLIGCVCAVIIGRLMEVFDYYVFTDRKLDIANRAGCDRYIEKFGGTVLPSDFACISIKMVEIEAKNRQFGRARCDRMIADFCKILREVLPLDRAFIASNSLGQIVVFLEHFDAGQSYAFIGELQERCIRYNDENECWISFVWGISVSGKSRIHEIRKLMIHSINKASGAAEKAIEQPLSAGRLTDVEKCR